MKKFYSCFSILLFTIFWANTTYAQDCSLLQATLSTSESRCAATGSIKITVTGGSGSYKYKTIGPVNSNYTTTDSITGLSAGVYTVVINDIVSNCILTKTGIVVAGTYEDPRFVLNSVDVSCDNGNNASITVSGLQNGRSPFTYSIVAPSPMGIGTSNSTGVFTDLIAGDYSIQLTDSCGGIQTRSITLNNYTWRIDSYSFNKFSCDSASGFLKVIDSRGNISTVDGIPGFTYGVVTTTGDTTWSANAQFRIGVSGINSIEVFARDLCGTIKKVTASLFLIPAVNAQLIISNKTCNNFTASVSGVVNFFDPSFCLYDQNDVLISCNTTGIFTEIPYGTYCIKSHDACTDTTIVRCISVTPPPISINNLVDISNKNCTTFTAAITGKVGLTNPTFCLINNSNDTISCNNTGEFFNIPYGDYCISTKDDCRDTTISRCFSVSRPTPIVDPVIIPSYVNCTNFGFEVGGDSLTLPTYCLYDTNNVQISCNNTGIFDSIPLGSYCVTVHDLCTDTTITRCINVGVPSVINDLVINISNKTCSTFTASTSTHNLTNAAYCLYDSADVLINCDSSGVFNNLSYGSYCIKATNSCPDTTIVTCFVAAPPIPSIGATVTVTQKTCSTFTAEVKSKVNLTNPQFCLVQNINDTLDCNLTGKFENIPYGSYCILIKNSCYDTTMQVCFTNAPSPLTLTATASKSCNYGTSKFQINVSGNLPVNLKIYNPNDSLLIDSNFSSSPINIDNFPDLPASQKYTIIALDKCGNKDTVTLAPVIGFLNHSVSIVAKCPGSTWANGSGNIVATVTSNMGSLTVRIIKKDDNSVSWSPNMVSGASYNFNDLGPATYVLRYKANDACSIYKYDTIVVPPYQYPNLNRSSAYQCDVNGFSVGAVATNGVGPFTYEIIGSSPEVPSIIAGPQQNPIFDIDNGYNYSLVRLRALDACGNATLGDASILPLANNGIKVSLNCFDHPALLSVDTVFNSTYSWYKKTNMGNTDSTLIGSGYDFLIPNVSLSDTGIYICHLIVNSGCIERIFYSNVTGNCFPVLPVMQLEFNGKIINNKVPLNWSISNGEGLNYIIVERKINKNFVKIGRLDALNTAASTQYSFTDANPGEQNYYRLKIVKKDNSFVYSKIILIKKEVNSGIKIYPNPAKDILNIKFNYNDGHLYHISITNMLSQPVMEMNFTNNGDPLRIEKTKRITDGVYLVRINDTQTGEVYIQKVIFNSK